MSLLTAIDVPTFPKVLRIEPASQCNLSCIHCPTGTVDMKREIMSDGIFKKILHEIEIHKNDSKVIVLYHGGEPLLNKQFSQMVTLIKEIKPSFFIKTVSNGKSLTNSIARDVINSKLDAIEFSFDGSSAEESQFIRRNSNTEKTIKNIQNLIDLKQEFNTALPKIFISTTQFFNNNSISGDNNPLAPKWLKQSFSKNGIEEFKTSYAIQWPHMGDSGLFKIKHIQEHKSIIKECTHVIDTMTIRANGDVVACCYDLTSKLIMGNINESSLLEIWNGKQYSDLRASLQNKDFISICKNCSVVNSPSYLIPTWNQSTLKENHE